MRNNGINKRTVKISSLTQGGIKVVSTDASNLTELLEDMSAAGIHFDEDTMAMSINGQPATEKIPTGVMIITISEADPSLG